MIPKPRVTRLTSGSFGGLLFILSVPEGGGTRESFSFSELFLDHHFSDLLRQGINCILRGLAVRWLLNENTNDINLNKNYYITIFGKRERKGCVFGAWRGR